MGFRPEWLPPAEVFFRDNVQRFRARDRRATGLCPFHKDRNPSLSMDLDRGLFHCFTCGASGGDVVDFVMLRDGVKFPRACQILGTWDDDGYVPKPPTIPVRFLVLDYVIDGVPYRAEVRDERRNYADKIRRSYRDASDRLTELSLGDSESYVGEQEDCWARMARVLDELREMETA